MTRLITCAFCMLCLLNIEIITHDGECVEVRTSDNAYPCTDAVKIDTGCYDENGETELCGATWVEVGDD